MSVFLELNHLFLRNPRGGVEDVAAMKAAGFGAIFLNVGDYPPADWSVIRNRAAQQSVVCGPWLRTTAPDESFDRGKLSFLIQTADAWHSPLIVNSESEIDGTGSELTTLIREQVGDRDAALSTLPWPFSDVDWTPVHDMPVLPQVFGEDWGVDCADAVSEWHQRGVNCVVPTFGTYSGWQPSFYDLLSPYGLYTADDCGSQYAPWSPMGKHDPCTTSAYKPPPTGGDMKIGPNHGIEATYNRFKALDPKGCNPAFDPKHPDALPLDQLKAYDKWCRTMLILVSDHDASV